MARTVTQKNLVSVNFGDTEDDSYLNENLENVMQDAIDQLKNLRVRPSFSSIQQILSYAKSSQKAELN